MCRRGVWVCFASRKGGAVVCGPVENPLEWGDVEAGRLEREMGVGLSLLAS